MSDNIRLLSTLENVYTQHCMGIHNPRTRRRELRHDIHLQNLQNRRLKRTTKEKTSRLPHNGDRRQHSRNRRNRTTTHHESRRHSDRLQGQNESKIDGQRRNLRDQSTAPGPSSCSMRTDGDIGPHQSHELPNHNKTCARKPINSRDKRSNQQPIQGDRRGSRKLDLTKPQTHPTGIRGN